MDRSSHSSRSLGVMMTLTLVMLDSATLASRVSGFSSRLTLSSVRQDCTASTSTSGNEKGAKFKITLIPKMSKTVWNLFLLCVA